jgi:membrane-associated phospholipid phosphatase
MTEYLLRHPEAGWVSRAAVGLVGGALAGATSTLRVEAGQHFPTDVVVGAGIGIAAGVVVPLVHRGRRGMPSTRAWLQTTGGAVAGTVLGMLFAGRY